MAVSFLDIARNLGTRPTNNHVSIFPSILWEFDICKFKVSQFLFTFFFPHLLSFSVHMFVSAFVCVNGVCECVCAHTCVQICVSGICSVCVCDVNGCVSMCVSMVCVVYVSVGG